MSEELKPEVIIDVQSGYRVDKRYKVSVSHMPKRDRLFIKYCNQATRNDECHTYESNIDLEKILETELEKAFAQGYEVCFQEFAKPTFTKEDVEKATEAILQLAYEKKYRKTVSMEHFQLNYPDMVEIAANNAKAALNAVGKIEE